MKLHMLLLIGLAVGITGCARKEEAAPEPVTEPDPEPLVSEVAEEPVAEADETLAQIEDWRTESLLDHMHAHAEHLDDLNYALDDGDLERAMTPAYWLSRHKTVSGLPDELQPFVVRMRDAASAVEQAEDLESARAAAQQIGVECQGCHDASGVVVQ